MGKDKSDDKAKPEGVKVRSLKEELDFYDNVAKPINDALKAAEEWKKENGEK